MFRSGTWAPKDCKDHCVHCRLYNVSTDYEEYEYRCDLGHHINYQREKPCGLPEGSFYKATYYVATRKV